MSLAQEINTALDSFSEDADPIEVARFILKQLPRTQLLALLAEEVAHCQRHRARAVEVAAFERQFSGEGGRVELTFGNEFKKVLESPVRLGNGEDGLTFGALTIEQHRQRVQMLTKLRSGLDATISRHETAITMIEQAGVSCLNDIRDAA